MKPTISDGLIIVGLGSIGTGLFFWFNAGVALTVSGGILLAIGIAANIAEAGQGKKR